MVCGWLTLKANERYKLSAMHESFDFAECSVDVQQCVRSCTNQVLERIRRERCTVLCIRLSLFFRFCRCEQPHERLSSLISKWTSILIHCASIRAIGSWLVSFWQDEKVGGKCIFSFNEWTQKQLSLLTSTGKKQVLVQRLLKSFRLADCRHPWLRQKKRQSHPHYVEFFFFFFLDEGKSARRGSCQWRRPLISDSSWLCSSEATGEKKKWKFQLFRLPLYRGAGFISGDPGLAWSVRE